MILFADTYKHIPRPQYVKQVMYNLCDLIRHSTYGSYNIRDTYALSQVSTIGMEPPLAIQLQPLKSNRLQTCQLGLSNGQYRVTWDFQIAFGYAFIREVNFTTGICNNTGMCKVDNFHKGLQSHALCIVSPLASEISNSIVFNFISGWISRTSPLHPPKHVNASLTIIKHVMAWCQNPLAYVTL